VIAALCCLLAGSAASLYQSALRLTRERPFVDAGVARESQGGRSRHFPTRFLLGAALVRLERVPEAIVELESAHALRPAEVDVVKLLAIQYNSLGRFADSLRVLAATPEKLRDEELYLLLIESHHESGSPDEAGRLTRRASRGFRLRPPSTLGWAST
jgi:tetratricopeptide (TPR) repeat protein